MPAATQRSKAPSGRSPRSPPRLNCACFPVRRPRWQVRQARRCHPRLRRDRRSQARRHPRAGLRHEGHGRETDRARRGVEAVGSGHVELGEGAGPRCSTTTSACCRTRRRAWKENPDRAAAPAVTCRWRSRACPGCGTRSARWRWPPCRPRSAPPGRWSPASKDSFRSVAPAS